MLEVPQKPIGDTETPRGARPLPPCGTVRARAGGEVVQHEDFGRAASHAFLNKNVERDGVLIHLMPGIVMLSPDPDEHLLQMSLV